MFTPCRSRAGRCVGLLGLLGFSACSLPDDSGGALALEARPEHMFAVPRSATEYDAGAVNYVPCDDLNGFATHALPALVASCGPDCHDRGSIPAFSALNLNGIGEVPLSPETLEMVCGHVRAKVSSNEIPESPLFLSPDPATLNEHKDEFGFETTEENQAFVNAVMAWLATELGDGAAATPATGGTEVPAGGGEPTAMNGTPAGPMPAGATGEAQTGGVTVAPPAESLPVNPADAPADGGLQP